MSPTCPRQALRLAQLLHLRLDQIQAQRVAQAHVRLCTLLETLGELKETQARLAHCICRSWQAAAAELRAQARSQLRCLPAELAEMDAILACGPPPPVPTVRDLLADLEQLEAEFGAYRWEPRPRILSVQTDPIVLEDTDFGPFAIRLALDRLTSRPGSSAYTVVALEPHPAASDDLVTHPHVSADQLCEGRAARLIRETLGAGRLCEFFLLVRSVLETYNGASPFVSLDGWSGGTCADCGDTLADDDTYYCHGCDEPLCSDCIRFCTSCDDPCCPACRLDCARCGRSVCLGCRSLCAGCARVTCRLCLRDGLCLTCCPPPPLEKDLHAPTNPPSPAPLPPDLPCADAA